MIHTAVILAGGFGTRLQQVVSNLPKPMAPVNGKPFLHYVISDLKKKKISRVILATGYMHQSVEDFFGTAYMGIDITYSVETEPLGTGGAIKRAITFATGDVAVINGDTFFDIDFQLLYSKFKERYFDICIALKPMHNFDRYGTVTMDNKNRITAFVEKKFLEHGVINGGSYILNSDIFIKNDFPAKFSFEKDVLEREVRSMKFGGVIFDTYFIDIGVPEDYKKAQHDFR